MNRRSRVGAVAVELTNDEIEAMTAVLRSGRLVQGEQVAHFEAEFADLVAGAHCVAVNSGTSALHVALLAAGIGAGDEVIVPSFTFAATANAVALTGATPIFADIEPVTFCLDPREVEARITRRTRAIVPVHLYGHPADMPRLLEVASRHDLLVIEDACQAHAAAVDTAPVGSLGHMAAFSFYATKNMTTGEGGMLTTKDPELALRARLLRNQGMERRYENELIGLNYRMTDVAAALGRIQLTKLPAMNSARRAIALNYDATIRGLVLPQVRDGFSHVFHQYTVRSDRRDELMAFLDARGIDSAVYYPIPAHRLPSFASSGEPLTETDRSATEVLSLPIRPGLSPDDQSRVIDAVNEFGDLR
ncbi:DegT/DnrJ/EryC1/StrS family aminotransferase [Nocardioides sp. Kera G14]|uniref:DegT/DnrJ/EryC1/StrS family aminotransferase n=1 Tax=Nocardioides sp. Kera G14 TaxID=2884264 RepID=UPI001D126C77|nr:DegT/DnrJ/EryC1/StrS family aminotransferase [Nocardioides sp. Kera G14]UDY22538.1 DegT/DnrJ/EryC1/StrS family aminotransferase [Nocardioides sp. Kera G14]